MRKLAVNFFALAIALAVVYNAILFFREYIEKYYSGLAPLEKNLSNAQGLQNDLEMGKIVIFGSSELVHRSHRFIPQNYFNKELKLPLTANGSAGHQSFAILSQLAACHNDKIIRNAKVVIFLSPGWFYGNASLGTTTPKFLKYMYSAMLYKLYFSSEVSDGYKILIGNYIKAHLHEMKNPSYIYKYANNVTSNNYFANLLDDIIINSVIRSVNFTNSSDVINYPRNTPSIDFIALKKEAKKIESDKSTNNKIGINNSYFNKYVKPQIQKGSFPYSIATPPPLDENVEFQDFLNLVDLLKQYNIRPLFVMQDLNPYAYKTNRDSMLPLLSSIKNELNLAGFGYLDMWTYDTKKYQLGTLTDVMHTGELGWVQINQKIISHFIDDSKND